MKKNIIYILLAVLALLIISFVYLQNKNYKVADSIMSESKSKVSTEMSFFITSKNPGQGGNLGGIAGADNYCKILAESVGVKNKNWAAYLSTNENGKIINAKDRIGNGPWINVKGDTIAMDIDNLHEANNLTKSSALNEKGEIVLGRGDASNFHDILTGSDSLGNYFATSTDSTCSNWTSSENGSAMVGHHDRVGRDESANMKSWNSSHLTRGCSLDNFKTTGGSGLFYCFAK